MADNRKNLNTEFKKRIIKVETRYVLRPFDTADTKIEVKIIYVLDTGNLISDVQHNVHYEIKTMSIGNYDMYTEQRCKRAQDKLKRNLESAIRATGANKLNAEITAKRLLKEMYCNIQRKYY